MQRKFKQWWSIIPPIFAKQTITYRNSLIHRTQKKSRNHDLYLEIQVLQKRLHWDNVYHMYLLVVYHAQTFIWQRENTSLIFGQCHMHDYEAPCCITLFKPFKVYTLFPPLHIHDSLRVKQQSVFLLTHSTDDNQNSAN